MELTPYLISIIRAKAEHPVLASFRRDVNKIDSKIVAEEINWYLEKQKTL